MILNTRIARAIKTSLLLSSLTATACAGGPAKQDHKTGLARCSLSIPVIMYEAESKLDVIVFIACHYRNPAKQQQATLCFVAWAAKTQVDVYYDDLDLLRRLLEMREKLAPVCSP